MQSHLSEETINLVVDEQYELDDAQCEHLAGCFQCQEELDLAEAVHAALTAVPRMMAPAALIEGVMGAIESARAAQRKIMAVVVSLVVASLVAAGIWLWLGGVATVAVEALALTRFVGSVTRVAATVGRAFPAEVIGMCALALILCTAGLGRVVTRTRAAEAG